MDISVFVAQFPITASIMQNLNYILSLVNEANTDELVVFPEGALSGYSEDPSFVYSIDKAQLKDALDVLREVAVDKGVHLVFGSCYWDAGHWYNAGLYYSPSKTSFVYRKVNLAVHEWEAFAAGCELQTFTVQFENAAVIMGMQLCREIRFPEQWQYLATQGAQVLVYLTNASNPKENLSVWRSHLVSRAAENQRFVLSANTAHAIQHCPTMIISPKGVVLKETVSEKAEALRHTLHLPDVSNWYLGQRRLGSGGAVSQRPQGAERA